MSPPRILLVEDEQNLARALKLNLSLEGYEVAHAATARDAGRLMVDPTGFDAILLDVQLPDVDGFTFCERLREAGDYTPVLMLTARNAPEDRVAGLEAGADDYLPKPFELAELFARVKSLLRRARWSRAEGDDGGASVLRFGDAVVDFAAHQVTVGDQEITLTKLELDLLRYFAENAGRVLSRGELLENVWHVDRNANTRAVDNFIVRLRRHLEPDPKRPAHIVSVRGAGYKFEP
jgi:DNA-binding response OmpR family regulator